MATMAVEYRIHIIGMWKLYHQQIGYTVRSQLEIAGQHRPQLHEKYSLECVSRITLWNIYIVATNQPCIFRIVPSHKSQDARNTYPTIHQFVTEICTATTHTFVSETCTVVHIPVTNWCIVGYCTGALWHLWDGYSKTVVATFTLWNFCESII